MCLCLRPESQVPHLRWSQAPPLPWQRPGSADTWNMNAYGIKKLRRSEKAPTFLRPPGQNDEQTSQGPLSSDCRKLIATPFLASSVHLSMVCVATSPTRIGYEHFHHPVTSFHDSSTFNSCAFVRVSALCVCARVLSALHMI